MRVLHLATDDALAGASRAAQRLHKGLQLNGIDSTMLVAYKQSCDDSVIQIQLDRALPARATRRTRALELAISRNLQYGKEKLPGVEDFTDDRTCYLWDLPRQVQGYDVVVIHWTAGFMDWMSVFKALQNTSTIVVFVLHDMSTFTGGCHYDTGCGRFANSCGLCPKLLSKSKVDLSSDILNRKKRALKLIPEERIRVVAPSRWIASEARRSSLLKNLAIETIALGIETEIFKPSDKNAAKSMLGIRPSEIVIATGAQDIKDPRKGTDLLRKALELLPSRDDIVLVTIGGGPPVQIDDIKCINTGFINNDYLLSGVLGASDIFVIPSREEVSGQIAIEAMACAVPVIGFAVGGIPDYVRPGETGLLAQSLDSDSLSSAIWQLVQSPQLRLSLGKNCRFVCESEFSIYKQAAHNIEMCKTAIFSH